MRKNIAEALDIDISQVSVKATTEEGLGFTGRSEGIAAQAVCILESPSDLSAPDITQDMSACQKNGDKGCCMSDSTSVGAQTFRCSNCQMHDK